MAKLDGKAQVRLRNWFRAPYDDAIAAARTCYAPRVIDIDEITPGQRERIGPLTYGGGHHTVFQHATFEFSLEGVSRQLVWSLLHSFPFYNTEQQSQRYVKLGEVAAHVPASLQGEARQVYVDSIESAWDAYGELSKRLAGVTLNVLSDLWRLKDRQSQAFGRSVAKESEKKAIETARYVIPLAAHTAMVYTVSGLVLHRLRRMAAVSDVPEEAREVIGQMVGEVERIDPLFFQAIGDATLAPEEVLENQLAEAGVGSLEAAQAFDTSLEGCTARLVDYSARAPQVLAEAVRNVLGRPALSDTDAIAMALDPARNRYRLETMNVSVHSPLMRALSHATYTFRKKLSHTADSQDQRHRMVPGSRPLLSRTVPGEVDVIVPGLIEEDPTCHALFRETVEAQWEARSKLLALGVSPEVALYVLPNATAIRFEESGSLLHLLHKWTMRTCFNAQREIWDASMDEIDQVRGVHPELVAHAGPPCATRNGLIRPRCTEGTHFCGVPVWKSFPEVTRVI